MEFRVISKLITSYLSITVYLVKQALAWYCSLLTTCSLNCCNTIFSLVLHFAKLCAYLIIFSLVLSQSNLPAIYSLSISLFSLFLSLSPRIRSQIASSW